MPRYGSHESVMLTKLRHRIIGQVVRENLDYLVRFAFFRLADRAEAEDAVHDAVLRLLEHDSKSLRPSAVRMYLFRTVYNICNDAARQYVRRPEPVDSSDIPDPGGEDAADIAEAERIAALLAVLPEREREVVRMNVVDELSFVEISRILCIPQSTAKSRFRAGMARLRREAGITPSLPSRKKHQL